MGGEDELPERSGTEWPASAAVATELDRLTALADRELPDPVKVDVHVWDDGTFEATAVHVSQFDERITIEREGEAYILRHLKGSTTVEQRRLEAP